MLCTGIQTGHEDVYRREDFMGWGGYEAEVTTWVEPYSDPTVDKTVLQIRHPLKVIGSLVITQAINELDTVEKACAWYWEFIQKWYDKVDYVYRIEDISTPKAYKGLLERLWPERQWISAHLAAALAYVPFDYNSRPHPNPLWDDLPDEIVDFAREHDYE
jgi:hypothetical protein